MFIASAPVLNVIRFIFAFSGPRGPKGDPGLRGEKGSTGSFDFLMLMVSVRHAEKIQKHLKYLIKI